jgi:hypothetical protein
MATIISITEDRYSDLQFYKDDLKFLPRTNGGTAKELSDESKTCDALLDKTVMHLKHLRTY